MIDNLIGQSQSKSLSSLFVGLWAAAEEWAPNDRAGALLPGKMFDSQVKAALDLSDEETAFDALKEVWNRPVSDPPSFRGQILAIMRAIDQVFYHIHPRALGRAPSRGGRTGMPAWLLDARERREVTGAYFETGVRRLIARGPLCRPSRQPIAANADSLADRFSALDVVPTSLDQAGRIISIEHRFIPVDAVRGVTPSATVGHEKIVFIPVAERVGDIAQVPVRRGDAVFVDFRAHPSIDPPQCIINALTQAGSCDVALASELVVSEDDADKLAHGLLHATLPHRLIVSGSGPTRKTKDDQPWNEARVFNGYGTEIWRQRKVWPAGITRSLAIQYGLPDPGDGQVYEDTASGHEISVIDADGIGRCIVLICQDLQARPLTDDLIRLFQPDWVFIPVLDYGVPVGRWAHRRSLELSSLSQARFLISSSLSLAEALNIDPLPPCGLAVGPSNPASKEGEPLEDEERVVKEAHADQSKKPSFANLTWRSGDWKKTVVTAE